LEFFIFFSTVAVSESTAECVRLTGRIAELEAENAQLRNGWIDASKETPPILQGRELHVKIIKTRHGNFDFYIYLDGTPRAVSVDSWISREDCESVALKIMQCVDCSKSLADWKQAEEEHINETLASEEIKL
jgi:hypothetical protein